MHSSTYSFSRLRLVTLVLSAAVLMLLPGCDTTSSPEPITLQPIETTFRFDFASRNLEPDGTLEVPSSASVDLNDLLTEGFSKAEVLSAEVTSVELERLSPLSDLSLFMRNASFSLQGGTGTPVTVAGLTDFPDAVSADMTLASDTRVTNVVTGSSFSGVLDVDVNAAEEEDFVLLVTVTLQVRVEGV